MAFIRKYVRQISIDPWGNIEIYGCFEVPEKIKGAFGRWAKGRVMHDVLISHNFNNVKTIPEER